MKICKRSSNLAVMGSVYAEGGHSFAGNQHFCIVRRKAQSDASFPLTPLNRILCQM